MPSSGIANRKNIRLSQKRTCGRIDRGAGVYNGCYAHEDRTRNHNGYCHLGFKCDNDIPLEPCLKPKTAMQYSFAMKVRGLGGGK
uniref:Uncharacterized protein n=1 Tax=viral metagenome TaxID=1070528 RepID=A0A6H1ZXI0_9ZZZZ